MAQLVWALVRKFLAATWSPAACDYPAPVLRRIRYMHAAATVNELCRAGVCVHCITVCRSDCQNSSLRRGIAGRVLSWPKRRREWRARCAEGPSPAFDRSADDVTVLPGVMPIVGRAEKEAFEKLDGLQSFVSGSSENRAINLWTA